jgi:hypothetical protein
MATQTMPQTAPLIPPASEPRPQRHELCIQDRTGDMKIHWDSAKAEEVATAKQSFDTWKKKGYAAYKMTARGDKGELIQTFDPEAEKIILAPPMVGG